jgi:retron-type reverse transcriptase
VEKVFKINSEKKTEINLNKTAILTLPMANKPLSKSKTTPRKRNTDLNTVSNSPISVKENDIS